MYTYEMGKAIRKVYKPFPFTMDVRESDWGLTLIIYPDEMGKVSESDKLTVLNYLSEVATLLQSFDVKVRIKGVSGVPKRV